MFIFNMLYQILWKWIYELYVILKIEQNKVMYVNQIFTFSTDNYAGFFVKAIKANFGQNPAHYQSKYNGKGSEWCYKHRSKN